MIRWGFRPAAISIPRPPPRSRYSASEVMGLGWRTRWTRVTSGRGDGEGDVEVDLDLVLDLEGAHHGGEGLDPILRLHDGHAPRQPAIGGGGQVEGDGAALA